MRRIYSAGLPFITFVVFPAIHFAVPPFSQDLSPPGSVYFHYSTFLLVKNIFICFSCDNNIRLFQPVYLSPRYHNLRSMPSLYLLSPSVMKTEEGIYIPTFNQCGSNLNAEETRFSAIFARPSFLSTSPLRPFVVGIIPFSSIQPRSSIHISLRRWLIIVGKDLLQQIVRRTLMPDYLILNSITTFPGICR